MSVSPEVIHIVRQWLERAEEDFKNAEHTLSLKEGCPFGTVCFHAQQVAEKYIKALLTYFGVEFPKSHDIGELMALLPAEVGLPLSPEEQEVLTRYATVTRYPGNWEPLLREDAEKALEYCRKARIAIRKLLPANAVQ